MGGGEDEGRTGRGVRGGGDEGEEKIRGEEEMRGRRRQRGRKIRGGGSGGVGA